MVAADPAAGELRASRVRVPSEMIAVADGDADGVYDYMMSPLPGLWGPPGSIHRSGANVLFGDGHVQWYLQDHLMKPPAGTSGERMGRWYQMERMWNNDNTVDLNN